MVNFSVSTDKDKYKFGDAARIEVRAEWAEAADRGSSDLWATLIVEQQGEDGKWGSPEEYPDFPMNELSKEGSTDLGWVCHAIRKGQWGKFKARAIVFEPERHEVGEAEVEFAIEGDE